MKFSKSFFFFWSTFSPAILSIDYRITFLKIDPWISHLLEDLKPFWVVLYIGVTDTKEENWVTWLPPEMGWLGTLLATAAPAPTVSIGLGWLCSGKVVAILGKWIKGVCFSFLQKGKNLIIRKDLVEKGNVFPFCRIQFCKWRCV